MTERIRGRRLQKIRRAHFMQHPLCVECQRQGKVSRATQLDHIIALTNGGLDFDQDDGMNRQGLCDDCHAIKTAKDLGHKDISTSLDGIPTRANHHWNR